MFDQLSSEDRLRLIRFVCSFAWADIEIRDEERQFVLDLIRDLQLNADEKAEVAQYLLEPPRPEEIDPMDIPVSHKKIFLDMALGMIASDGQIVPREAANYNLLQQLIG